MARRSGAVVIDNMGIIAQLAYKCWIRLPASAQQEVGVEDLVSECVLVCYRKSHKHRTAKSKSSTWIHCLAVRYFQNVALRYQQQCRQTTGLVPIEEWLGGAVPCNNIRWAQARDGMESLLRYCSDDLRRGFERFLVSRRSDIILDDPKLLAELKFQLRQNRVSRDDLALVLSVI
jgi:hypothetical protein